MALISVVVVCAAGWTTFVAFRLKATYAIEREVALIRAESADAERVSAAERATLMDRVKALEQTVFAELEPKSKQPIPRTPAELWQRGRDEEIRKRLTALERWRMEQSR